MSGSANNFGKHADDDDEIGDDAVDHLGLAADLYGGDLPAVFGASCYAGFFDFLKPSKARLQKRLARKKRRLKKLVARLEAKEDAGKKGLGVKMLRWRITKLERAIPRIEGKLERFDASADKVSTSKAKAEKVEKAETQVVKEAMSDEDDDLGDELSDEELGEALELFGRAPRRVRRARRRVRRLRTRARRSRPRRARRLRRRARRLHRRMRRRPGRWARWHRRYAPVAIEPAPVYPIYYAEPLLELDPDDEAWLAEEEEASDVLGAEDRYAVDTKLPAPTAALVGYFAKRAAMYGADVTDEAAYGEGFFKRVGDWFKNLWGKGKTAVKRQQSAAQAARAARKPLTPAVQTSRKQLREAKRARRQAARAAAQAARKGVPAAVAKPGVRMVRGAGGYVYQQNPDGSILVVEGPTRQGQTLTQGPAWTAITAEIASKTAATVGMLVPAYVTTPEYKALQAATMVAKENPTKRNKRRLAKAQRAFNKMVAQKPATGVDVLGFYGAQAAAKGPLETLFSTPRKDIPAAAARQLDVALKHRGIFPTREEDEDADLDEDEDEEYGGRRGRRRRLRRLLKTGRRRGLFKRRLTPAARRRIRRRLERLEGEEDDDFGRRRPRTRRRSRRRRLTRRDLQPSRQRVTRRGRTIQRMQRQQSRGRLGPKGQRRLAKMQRVQRSAERYWQRQDQGSGYRVPTVLDVMGAQMGATPMEQAKALEKKMRAILGGYKWKLMRHVKRLTDLAKRHDQLVTVAHRDQLEALSDERDKYLRAGISGTFGGAYAWIGVEDVSYAA
jgi:hypothetical protein